MQYTPALSRGTIAPRRIHISTSFLMSVGVAALCAMAVFFARFNQEPPENDRLPVAAPFNEDQEQANPTPTPALTATPVAGNESSSGVPTALPMTATPVPGAGSGPRPDAMYYTVTEGITFLDIAERNNLSVDALLALNELTEVPTLVPGQQIIVALIGATATAVPWDGSVDFMTATPVPAMLSPTTVPPNSLQPRYQDAFAGENVPPLVWFPGDANVSAPTSSGLMIAIPAERLHRVDASGELAAGQSVKLYTLFGQPSDGEAVSAAGISSAAIVHDVDETNVVVRVPLEQGIVLNWLLGDTPAVIYLELWG